MRRLVTRGLVLGALLLGLLATAHSADANPFERGNAPGPSAAAPSAAPGWLDGITATIVRLQRDATAGLSRALARVRDGGSPGALATAFALAFLYGGFHAIGPGHGKAVVISYFLSRDARWPRGFLLGARIAGTHVASAVIVVVVAQLLLDLALSPSLEDMRPVQQVSYGAVVLIGLLLLRGAWNRRRDDSPAAACCHGHGHGHAPHEHGHDHAHGHGAPAAAGDRAGLMGFVLGMVPCTGAVLVLVFALANAMLGVGLLLVLAIALGMAVTMGLLGIGAILARQRMQAWALAGSAPAGRLTRLLDLGGPAFILLFGLGLLGTTL